jgi:hypothetical protein
MLDAKKKQEGEKKVEGDKIVEPEPPPSSSQYRKEAEK